MIGNNFRDIPTIRRHIRPADFDNPAEAEFRLAQADTKIEDSMYNAFIELKIILKTLRKKRLKN